VRNKFPARTSVHVRRCDIVTFSLIIAVEYISNGSNHDFNKKEF
jgi:hypothetical protein